MDLAAALHLTPIGENLKNITENFQDEKESSKLGVMSLVSMFFMGLLALVGLAIFFYASYLTYRCTGLPIWGRILLFISYFIFPIVSPLAFIIFNYFSPICRATRIVLPKTIAIPEITIPEVSF